MVFELYIHMETGKLYRTGRIREYRLPVIDQSVVKDGLTIDRIFYVVASAAVGYFMIHVVVFLLR